MLQLFWIIAALIGWPLAMLLAFLLSAAMPFLVVWVVWHYLYQQKRIADALEAQAYRAPIQERPHGALAGDESREQERRVSNSMFGR